jgi:hypothetical protein
MNIPPVETIVIERLKNSGAISTCMVIRIPPTIAEHNVVIELLKRLRVDHPGAWYCVQQWERQHFHGPIQTPAPKPEEPFEGVKEVTREHLGLPQEEPITDMPQ